MDIDVFCVWTVWASNPHARGAIIYRVLLGVLVSSPPIIGVARQLCPLRGYSMCVIATWAVYWLLPPFLPSWLCDSASKFSGHPSSHALLAVLGLAVTPRIAMRALTTTSLTNLPSQREHVCDNPNRFCASRVLATPNSPTLSFLSWVKRGTAPPRVLYQSCFGSHSLSHRQGTPPVSRNSKRSLSVPTEAQVNLLSQLV